MGVKGLETISAQLQAAGLPGETPAALIYRATWPEQRIYPSRLDLLPETAKEFAVKPPTQNWLKLNWQKKKNVDLWIELFNLCDNLKIDWKHIKGHSKDKWNEYCDRLSRNCRNKELQFEGGRL